MIIYKYKSDCPTLFDALQILRIGEFVSNFESKISDKYFTGVIVRIQSTTSRNIILHSPNFQAMQMVIIPTYNNLNKMVKYSNIGISFDFEAFKNHRRNIQTIDFEMIDCIVRLYNFFTRFVL